MKFYTSLINGFTLSTLRTQGFYTALTQLKNSGIMSVIITIPKLIAGLVAYRIEMGKDLVKVKLFLTNLL